MNTVKPTPKDLEAIMMLWGGQYKYHYNLDSTYYISIDDESQEKFKSYLKKAIENGEPQILIAKEKDEVVGFITFETSEADYFDTKIKKYGEVIELFVAEEFRKKGIGKKLLEDVEEYFRKQGIKHIKLQVSTFNTNAFGAYKHMGYVNRQTLMFKKI